jgi:ABC-2 type transport system permease protein
MKVLDIAFKDMLRSFRSYFALAFMFGVPILMTAIFYLAFGGLRSGGGEFNLPQTIVVIANLDQGSAQFSTGISSDLQNLSNENSVDFSGAKSLGDMVTIMLSSGSLQDVMQVSQASDASSAMKLVDEQKAGAAVIIPSDFTSQVFSTGGKTSIELYKDPTLSLGPSIVEGIIRQFVDSFAATRITIQVAQSELNQAGLSLEGAAVQDLMQKAVSLSSQQGQSAGSTGVAVISPSGASDSSSSQEFFLIIGSVMGGMMIFYAFFTGTSTAQSILTEEEKGTLQRLFTTPTSHSVILGGKLLAIELTILVQVAVLLLFSSLVFGIHLGNFLYLVLFTVALSLAAGAFGLFLMSLLKNTRQVGVIYGAVVSVSGMIGISSVFTLGSNSGSFTDTLSLVVPQGWGMRALLKIMAGADSGIILASLAGLLGWGIVLFFLGMIRFRKRFA